MTACELLSKLGLRTGDCRTPPVTQFEAIVPVLEAQDIHPPSLGQTITDGDMHFSVYWIIPVLFVLLSGLLWFWLVVNPEKRAILRNAINLLRLRRARIAQQRSGRYNSPFPFNVGESVSEPCVIQEVHDATPAATSGSCVIKLDH